MNVENAIEQTVSLAKAFLFDKNGHPKGFNHYLANLTLTTVIRSPSELAPARSPGCYVEFEWEGSPFVYDLGIAEILLEKANGGSIAEDQILCNAAAILLSATKGISDSRLRNYEVAVEMPREAKLMTMAIQAVVLALRISSACSDRV